VSASYTDIAKSFWNIANVSHKNDLRLAPALDALQELLDNGESGTFDFVFIDADKTNYPNYYEKSLELLRPGGLIAIDNVLQNGKVVDKNAQEQITIAIRAFNSALLSDKRVTLSMLPIGDGLTLARKR
jgi:caffeoyl-CoA O-methyltransferase